MTKTWTRDPDRTYLKFKTAYKRLERDEEFVKRINAKGGEPAGSFAKGEVLDDYAWNNHKMQRRIVEDVA